MKYYNYIVSKAISYLHQSQYQENMSAKHIPVANATLPFWRTDPHPLDNYRSSETLPEQSDVVIIGAGYAGTSVAHHILRKVKPGTKAPSITILEARQACSGATARNGKRITPIDRASIDNGD